MPDNHGVLYGRTNLVEGLTRCQAPLSLLTGDSGAGKTAVLVAATMRRDGWFCSAKIDLPEAAGILYPSFLTGLADVLGQLIDSGIAARTVDEAVGEAARRMLNMPLGALGRVAAAELVALLRGKYGDQVGRATEEMLRDVWPDSAERLTSRVLQAREPLASEVMAEFARCTAQLAPTAHFALSYDEGQRLSDDDLRQMRDLARLLPNTVHLRLSFTTDTVSTTAQAVALATELGNTLVRFEVPPLTESDVAEWLSHEGLDENLAEEILADTGGNPLLVDVAVASLLAGGTATAERHERFEQRMAFSFSSLTAETAAVARRLAVLSDPPTEPILRRIAGVPDAAAWATIADELAASRMFSNPVNGRVWFHPRRRRYIVDRCLNEQQRREVAAAASAELWQEVESALDTTLISQWSSVAELAPDEAGGAQVAAVLARSPAELAVLAALIEIATAQGIAGDADTIFAYADRFGVRIDDPSAVLGRLVDAGLVETASNDRATAIVADWDLKTCLFIQGRCARVLGKVAMFKLAELAFTVDLEPALGSFARAGFGLGYLTFGPLSRLAYDIPAEPNIQGGPNIDRRNLIDHLLVRGAIFDEVPLYCAVRYETIEERDQAQQAIADLRPSEHLGARVIDALPHPTYPVRPNRFAIALVRADTGAPQRLAADTFHLSGENAPAQPELSDEQIAERRVQAAQAMSARCDPVERAAFELDRGYFLGWDATDGYSEECVIHGKGFGQSRATMQFTDARYEVFDLRRSLDLTGLETIVHRSGSWGSSPRTEPVAEEIVYRRGRARVFNSTQPLVHLSLDPGALFTFIRTEFEARLADAHAFVEALGLPGSPRSEPRRLSVLIALDDHTPGFVAGRTAHIEWSEQASETGATEVRVEVVPGIVTTPGFTTVERGTFARVYPGAVGPRGGGHSEMPLWMGLAALSGYDDRDFWFSRPGEE